MNRMQLATLLAIRAGSYCQKESMSMTRSNAYAWGKLSRWAGDYSERPFLSRWLWNHSRHLRDRESGQYGARF